VLTLVSSSFICCRFFREVEENCFRAEPRIRDMDEQHVNVQVLSTVPVMFSYQAKPEDALDLHKSVDRDDMRWETHGVLGR
jgi:hypothetical protein